MGKSVPLCAICLLGVIAIASFGFVYLILHHHKACKNGTCVVKIDLGHLRGRERETVLTQKTYYSFQGIPYAKPPVGPLRFKDPEPIDHWHTIIEATKEGNECLQRGPSREYGDTIGSEDCLYLNVYTTQFPDHDITRHPVMVYFHSGGFTYGSGNEVELGADYLVEMNVVLVTVNYRIGALGFLSLANDDIPGNAGLKDQRLALQWVKAHISHFGGDPNSVTIFGNSAGAASVQYHMLSPLSKGLFHNAIMLSGSALNPWAFEENPVPKAFRFGTLLGIHTNNTKELAEYLRLKSSLDIIYFQNSVRTEKDLMKCISFPFVPSVEKPSPKSFLTENPKKLLEKGNFYRVPTIIGITENEGLIIFTRSDVSNYFYDDVGRFVPSDLHLDKDSDYFLNVANKIKEFYFHNLTPSSDRLDDFINICGDVEFVIGMQYSIDFLRNSTVPVYVEKFTYDGKYSFPSNRLKRRWPFYNLPAGPGHEDDRPYFFHSIESDNITDAEEEIKMVKFMASMMTSFATYQNPSQISGVKWNATKKNDPNFLDIGEQFLEVSDTLLSQDKYIFWSSIYGKRL